MYVCQYFQTQTDTHRHVALEYSCRCQNIPPQHLLPRQKMLIASFAQAKDANGNLQPTIDVTMHVYEQN